MKNRTNVLGGGGYNDAKNGSIISQNDKEYCQNLQASCTKRHNYGLTLLNIAVLILALVFMAFTTYCTLKDSKTATGTIAFTFDSPAMSFDSGIGMFYSNVGMDGTLNSGEISYGDATAVSSIKNWNYNVGLDSDNKRGSYFVKIEYVFSDLSSAESKIEFDSTTYTFGTTSLGTVTAEGDLKNRFSLTSTAAVSTGVTFNLFEPLSHFTYTGGVFTTSAPQTVFIVISADSKKDMSDSRAQTTIATKLGFGIVASTISNMSALENATYEIVYSGGEYVSSTFSSSDSLIVTNPTKYIKIELQSSEPLYSAAAEINNTINNWKYTLTTDSSGSRLTAISASTLDTIDVASVLSNAPVGSFSDEKSDVLCTFSVYSSTDGATYTQMIDKNTLKFATASLKVNIVNYTAPTCTIDSNGTFEMWVLHNVSCGSDTYEGIDTHGACSIKLSPSAYIRGKFTISSATWVRTTSAEAIVDNVTYYAEASKNATSGYDFTLTSKSKVSNVDLLKTLAEAFENFFGCYTGSGTLVLYYSFNNIDFIDLNKSISITLNYQDMGEPKCCVTGDTEISTGLNGETMLAQDLRAGNYVLTMDTMTNALSLQKVTDIIVVTRDSIATVKLKDGSVLKLTPDHPILTQSGWATCTGESTYDVTPDALRDTPLKVGDLVKTQTGYAEVESIEIETLVEPITVYNFKVENNNNFFASGILLHS